MKYVVAYFRAFLTILTALSTGYFISRLEANNDLLAWYLVYVSMVAGVAGPIGQLFKR